MRGGGGDVRGGVGGGGGVWVWGGGVGWGWGVWGGVGGGSVGGGGGGVWWGGGGGGGGDYWWRVVEVVRVWEDVLAGTRLAGDAVAIGVRGGEEEFGGAMSYLYALGEGL